MIPLQARQLMAPALRCLDETDSVVLAARRMRALGVSSVPVNGAGDGFLGMVFERDIVEHCVAAAADPREMPVGALLRGPQESIAADRTADASVLGLVLRQPLGMLAVVDAGTLVGIITVAGIAAHLIDDPDDLDGDLDNEIGDDGDALQGHYWWPKRDLAPVAEPT